ncbi:MAG TPA: ABC transporter ATP-binding protein [Casimicrobiaceae bacterium]|nr:ABC transporter ATP-binding protein [Casimicrobiaceae bacterium]
MNPIRIEHLSKHWGDVRALDDVSFDVPKGSLTVLLGPSGCGKSTLLRLVAGLDRATSGRIVIDGVDVTLLPPHQRRISMVFQFYALFPHLTVEQNITFGLRIRKVDAKRRDERLRAVASLLGLSSLLHRRPSQLSGGQQQRVAMGRAIIAEAPVCLMDEPTSNLDAKLRNEMRTEIQALQRQLGITMLYVTHDQIEAMSMADQVVLLSAGRVEQVAAPAAMYSRPAGLFAAQFIGQPAMNVLRLEQTARGAAIAGSHGAAVIAHAAPGVVAGIRAEDIVLGADDGIESSVVGKEYLGADTMLRCRVGSEHILVRAGRNVPVQVGDALRLSWPDEALHLFDETSGHRVERVQHKPGRRAAMTTLDTIEPNPGGNR